MYLFYLSFKMDENCGPLTLAIKPLRMPYNARTVSLLPRTITARSIGKKT